MPRKRASTEETPVVRREDILPDMGDAGSSACLVTIYGPNLGSRFILDGVREVVVGREPPSELVIPSMVISREHARLYFSKGFYFIEDMGSTNGTYLNDIPVEVPVPLQLNDRIRLGTVIMKFLTGGDIENLYHEELYNVSITDGLLGIPNRRALSGFLEKEISRARRHERPLSMLMFDIDFFKNINDTHGHLAGDQVLKDLIALVSPKIRKEELLSRWGGEEFVAVLPETDHMGAMAVAEKIRSAVEEHTFYYHDITIKITVSVGVATWDEVFPDHNAWIRQADERLYHAKTHGRNLVIGQHSTLTLSPDEE